MLASIFRVFFLWLSNRRWLASIALHTPLLRRMPLRFVAGTNLDQAVVAVRTLNEAGAMATFDVLGESVGDRAAADRAGHDYVTTIERIAGEKLDANVSLKLTQMGLDLGVDACLEVMRPVVEAGARHGIFVRVDMEGAAYTERTLDVVRRLHADGSEVGVVLQAYLHRSKADAQALAAAGIRVRVCKGAYAEPADIAWHDRARIGQSFLEMTKLLLDADAYPAVATHDPEMIEAVKAFVEERGIRRDRFEFQMLYGIRRDLQRQLLEQGYRLRVYVPFGTEWFPYFMRRLAERPANVFFVLRTVFGERG